MSSGERIAIVDDKESMRRLIERIVVREGWEVECFASGDLFLGHPTSTQFAAILLDLRMPGTGGLAVLSILQEREDKAPVIVLTGHGGISDAVEAMKIGAVDFLQKPFAAKDLVASIENAIAETSDLSGDAAIGRAAEEAVKLLTRRQLQVLRGIVQGDANKVIAFNLGLSVRTVEAYRSQLLHKLGVRNTAGAVRLAIAAKLDCTPYVLRRAA